MLDLTGRAVIVTGGTKGIGRAIAVRVAGCGAHVTVAARSADDAQAAQDRLATIGSGRALGVACDVRRYDDCERLVAATVQAFGRLDVLVNNAGVGEFATVETMTVDQWNAVIETNLSGVFHCSRAAIPYLRQAGGGWILNMGSLAGRNTFPEGAAYNASKFGLVGFSEALMLEVRHDGIRVSCIMPGSVATEFNHPEPGTDASWRIQPEDIAQIVEDMLAMPARTLPSRVEVRPSRPPKR